MTNHFIHNTAIIDDNVCIGTGTKIWHWSHVCEHVKIGSNSIIGQNCFIGRNVIIGNNVKIQNNVSIYEGVELQDNVFCGPSMVFTNVINPRSNIDRKKDFKKTLVKKGSSIGANATILCGVILGKYSFVGAGAVVTKDVKDFSCVSGIPAKHLYWITKCGQKISFQNKYFFKDKFKYFLNDDFVICEEHD